MRQFYGTPSQYLYRLGRNDHTIITARKGIEQGGAAGPVLFACGLKRPLDELRAALRRLVREEEGYEADCENEGQEGEVDTADATAVFAYLDDTIVAVPSQYAAAAFDAAIEVFARAGHTVHPGKSGRWSLDTRRESLPPSCQRIWEPDGLLVGGISAYNQDTEPVLAQNRLREVVPNVAKEGDFLVKLVRDDQLSADESWSRVQATLLILRYTASPLS